MTHLSHSRHAGAPLRRAVLVGGGASGALVALHLLRSLAAGPRVELTLLDPSPSLGDGVAYGTRDDAHLLNVPAGRMGAFPEEPGDFLAWLQSSGHSARAGSFVPRALFGAYLRDRLAGAEAAAPGGVQLQHVRRRAVDLQRMPDGWRAVDDAGGCWDAEAVVLATGQAPAPTPPTWQVERLGESWMASPFGTPGLEAVSGQEDVLLLGTGLTAVDAVLTLARRNHRGRLLAVSRHGLWPLVHGPLEPETPAASPGMSLRAALRAVRAQARGGDGRARVDAMRGVTPALWQGWTPAERGRFVRHLRAAWDIHRHRMAPEAAAVLQPLLVDGRLTSVAGTVTGLERTARGVLATVRPRGGGAPLPFEVQRVVGCLGVSPLSGGGPLLEALLRRGTVTPDALGLGLEVDPDGSIPGAPGLYAVGPLRRGRLWESTAIPELRAQAQALGALLAAAT